MGWTRTAAVVVAFALVVSGVVVAGSTERLLAAGATERVLVVADAETGERYLAVPVADGTTVALEYTHSVERSRVYEAYTVRDRRFEATRMEFESYGWGLPSGANVTLENGTFVYDPPGSHRRLTVSPGRIAGHTLHVGPATYDLVALSDGRSVDLSLARRSRIAGATDRLVTDRLATNRPTINRLAMDRETSPHPPQVSPTPRLWTDRPVPPRVDRLADLSGRPSGGTDE